MNWLNRSWLLALGLLAATTSLATAQEKDVKPLFQKSGELTDKDSFDKIQKRSYSKVHEMKMEAGKVYRIDISSKDFDTFLRVEDANGKMLGFDDDGAGKGFDSRLIFKAPNDGDYRLIVTSFPPAETGKYLLTVTEPSKSDMLVMRARDFPKLAGEERTKVLEDLVAHFEAQGKGLTQADGQLAFQVAFAMENSRMPGVGDWYLKFSKSLSQAENPQIQNMSKLMEGSARRVRLPGNKMDIKGTLLDGKKIDWDAYRGKVVLVDFWATWCGPCVAELPNVKRMYEAYKGKGFDVVGISLDRDGDAPTKFMEKKELAWACIYERETKSQPLADHYGVMSIPLAILVDKEGKVVSMNARGSELVRLLERHLGPIPEAKTEDKIEEKK